MGWAPWVRVEEVLAILIDGHAVFHYGIATVNKINIKILISPEVRICCYP
jgi:hypothetical protein